MTGPLVNCKYCDSPTPHLGTKMCDSCWELERRIRNAPKQMLRKILDAKEVLGDS